GDNSSESLPFSSRKELRIASNSALAFSAPLIRLSSTAASASRPFRTSQRGDSGTRNKQMRNTTAGSTSIPSIPLQTCSHTTQFRNDPEPAASGPAVEALPAETCSNQALEK